MKKGITANLSILLLAALILSSCGKELSVQSEETTQDTTVAETIPANPYGDNLPEKMDLEQYDFRVLIFNNGNIIGHGNAWRAWIDVDELTGEVMNDAAYHRNAEVEERLNVHISCIELGEFGQTVPLVHTSVMAGEDEYDFTILQNDRTSISKLFVDNCLLDVNAIDAIELSQPYYLQSVRETLNINGKQFLISGDALCSLYSHSYVFTNMDLWEDYQLEDPYELVRSGKWTLDKCMTLVEGTYQDLNGNGIADKEDSFGITGLPATLAYCFHSGGGTLYESSDEGYSFPVVSERNVAIIERLVKELDNPDCFFNFENSSVYGDAYYAGRSLLFFSGSSITRLRDPEFYAGLLPFPKFDESQDAYYSILAGATAGLPITVSDPERTGTIVEALFSASARWIKPAFIQTYVENKVLRDEGSQEMFALIMDTGRHNFVDYVDPAGQFKGYDKLVTELLSKKSADLASRWASMKESVEQNYAEFFASIEE